MASQITILTIVHATVYSGADQRKHQGSVSLAFVWGIRRWPVNSPHKGPITVNVSIWWRHHDDNNPIATCPTSDDKVTTLISNYVLKNNGGVATHIPEVQWFIAAAHWNHTQNHFSLVLQDWSIDQFAWSLQRYNMSVMVSQTTGNPIVCSIGDPGQQQQWKTHHSSTYMAICDGNPPVTNGILICLFHHSYGIYTRKLSHPATQRATNAGSLSMSLCHI